MLKWNLKNPIWIKTKKTVWKFLKAGEKKEEGFDNEEGSIAKTQEENGNSFAKAKITTEQ